MTAPENAGDAEALRGVMAALAAAISLLERTPTAKKAAPSDKMFAHMLDDYRKALDYARAHLEAVAQRKEHAEPDEGRQDAGSIPAGFALTTPAAPGGGAGMVKAGEYADQAVKVAKECAQWLEVIMLETGWKEPEGEQHIAASIAKAAALSAAPAPAVTHPDDLAVDRFAAAMKEKLAKKRAQGRRGWDDKSDCTNAFLVKLLCEHVAKGDPVDVGNLAMMIHQRGERICT